MDTLGQLSAEKEDLRVHSQLLVIANNQSIDRLKALTDERPDAEKVDELKRMVHERDFLIEEHKVKEIQDATEITKLQKEVGICRNTIDLIKVQINNKDKEVQHKNANIADLEQRLTEFQRDSLLRLHEANTKTLGLGITLQHREKTHKAALEEKVNNSLF